MSAAAAVATASESAPRSSVRARAAITAAAARYTTRDSAATCAGERQSGSFRTPERATEGAVGSVQTRGAREAQV